MNAKLNETQRTIEVITAALENATIQKNGTLNIAKNRV